MSIPLSSKVLYYTCTSLLFKTFDTVLNCSLFVYCVVTLVCVSGPSGTANIVGVGRKLIICFFSIPASLKSGNAYSFMHTRFAYPL